MAAPGSSFVNCTALGKNLGVRPFVTLTEESPWEADPGDIPREAISSYNFIITMLGVFSVEKIGIQCFQHSALKYL